MPVVILYAELGKPDFQRFHQILTSKVYEGLAAYVLRHYVAVGVQTHTQAVLLWSNTVLM